MQITPPLNAWFTSTQGINIAVSYVIDEQIANGYTLYEAVKITLSVYGNKLRPAAKVSTVLLNRWEQGTTTTYQQSWVKPLYLAEQHEDIVAFTGTLMDAALVRCINQDGLVTVGVPQIAVVVDGAWQEDPAQWPGAHNFNFTWMMRRPSVARPTSSGG